MNGTLDNVGRQVILVLGSDVLKYDVYIVPVFTS